MTDAFSTDPVEKELHTRLQAELRMLLPQASLKLQAPPLIPELSLWLLGDIQAGEALEPQTAAVLMDTPPYWTFCWASGQVLARWLLDHPQQVRGRTLVDVGPGSGVVALAAAVAGADRVIACDIDPQALLAVQMNAAALGLSVELSGDLDDCMQQADILTAADILYDRENLPLLDRFRQVPLVWLADSRVRDLSPPGYRQLGRFPATTWPDLDESSEFNQVTLYEYHRPG